VIGCELAELEGLMQHSSPVSCGRWLHLVLTPYFDAINRAFKCHHMACAVHFHVGGVVLSKWLVASLCISVYCLRVLVMRVRL
jgi:hypothetical protein